MPARSPSYHRSRQPRGRLGGLARIALIVLGVILTTLVIVVILFKTLDWASGGSTDPGGHLHIL